MRVILATYVEGSWAAASVLDIELGTRLQKYKMPLKMPCRNVSHIAAVPGVKDQVDHHNGVQWVDLSAIYLLKLRGVGAAFTKPVDTG